MDAATTRYSVLVLLAASVSVFGCDSEGGAEDVGAPADVETITDTGQPTDSGQTADSGQPKDGSSDADVSQPCDSGEIAGPENLNIYMLAPERVKLRATTRSESPPVLHLEKMDEQGQYVEIGTDDAPGPIPGEDYSYYVVLDENVEPGRSYRYRAFFSVCPGEPVYSHVLEITTPSPVWEVSTVLSGYDFRGDYPNAVVDIASDGQALFLGHGSSIEKLDPQSRSLTTFAGNDSEAGQVDGVGTEARFNFIYFLANDDANLYAIDGPVPQADPINPPPQHYRVVAIDKLTATVTTVVELGVLVGIASDGTYLYLGDWYEITKYDVQSKQAVGQLPIPGRSARRMVVVGNTIYCAAMSAGLVFTVDKESGAFAEITDAKPVPFPLDGRFANASFFSPVSLIATGGSLFIADYPANNIRKMELSTTTASTVIDGPPGNQDGVGIQAQINRPYGMAAIGDSIYFADVKNGAIRRLAPVLQR